MLIKHLLSCCLLNLVMTSFAYSEEAYPSSMHVLQGKESTTKNLFEIGVFFFDTSIRNRFVKHPYAAHLAAGYHIADWLELEAVGGYVFYHDETNLIKRVRSLSSAAQALPLPQLWQTKWQVGLNGQWIPFYGKLSLFSEAQTHFQLYLTLGGALEGVMHVVDGPKNIEEDKRFALNVGGGLRLFLTDRIAFRSEIKESIGFNPNLKNGERDISWTAWVLFGVSFFI